MQETIFLDDKSLDVLVTSTRVRTGLKTYALNNVTSVALNEIKPKYTLQIILIVIGLIVLFNSVIPGAVLIALGMAWIYFEKPEYTVQINSNSGEAAAYKSKNRDEVEKIVDAVNKAIIHRG